MNNNHSIESKNVTWSVVILSNILIALAFYIIASWFGGVIMQLIIGKMPTPSDFVSTGTESVLIKKALLIGQIGGTMFGMVLLPIAYIIFLKKELINHLFNSSSTQLFPFIIIALSITIISIPVIGIIGEWNKNIQLPESWNNIDTLMRTMEEKASQMTKIIVDYNTTKELVLVLFTIAFLPALAEELVFRGILQNDLTRTTGNVHLSIFITSIVFSFIHFQFFGFFPRMLLGVILGYLYYTSGNILISMLMHFFNNAIVVIALHLHKTGAIQIDPETSKDLPVESIYLSAVLSGALLYICWKLLKQRTEGTIKNA